jgi:hypothetical protein
VLIENGTVYLTSLKPRNLGALGHNTMAAGFLLELLEASLRYRWVQGRSRQSWERCPGAVHDAAAATVRCNGANCVLQ